MPNAWFLESSDWKLWHDGACAFSWTAIYCFRHSLVAYFLLSIFKQKYMVTYLVLTLASGTKSCIYIKGEKWVRVCFWFDSVCFPKYNNSCLLLYIICYNEHLVHKHHCVFGKLLIWYYQNQQHSACFSLFGILWNDLAFFHKWFGIFCSLEPGNPVVQTFHFALCRPIC